MDDQDSSVTRESMKSYIKHEPSTTLMVATFSVISVTVGAGMVAVPNSAYNSGIPWAIVYNVFNFIAWLYSIHLYIKCAQVTGKYSMPLIGFEVMGRASLYIINFLQIIVFGFLPISYFIIFANLLKSLFLEIDWVENNAKNTIAGQWFSVLLLAIAIFPLIIKKKIAELKIAGVLLFSTVILFIILMFALKIFNSSNIDNKYPIATKDFYHLRIDKAFVSSLSTAFVAYGFQSAFFPIYNTLQGKNYKRGMAFTFFGMGFWFIIYMCIMFVSLYSFGIYVQGDVLLNVEEIKAWESYVLRVLFLMVMATHLPFIFFVGKESVLAIVALLYIRGDARREINKSIIIEEGEGDASPERTNSQRQEEMGLLSAPRVGDTNGVVKGKSLNNMELSDQLISSGAEKGIQGSIPFSDKKVKRVTLVGSIADGDEEIDTGTDLLPKWIYYTVTLLMYGAIVAGSCFIRDAESVLKFVGSLGNAFLNFTFPGAFYFVLMRRHQKHNKWWQLTFALLLAIYGTVMGFFLTGVNVWTTISPYNRPHPVE